MDWKPIETAPKQTLIEGRFPSGTVKIVEFKHGIWWYQVGFDFETCTPPKEWRAYNVHSSK